MVSIVSGAQMKIGYVGVDLSCGDVAMTQQGLNGTRVGAVLQKVRRKTVA